MVSSHVWPSLPLPGTLGGIRDRRRGLLRAPGGGPPRGPSSILDRESSGIGGMRICARGANCLRRVSPWPSSTVGAAQGEEEGRITPASSCSSRHFFSSSSKPRGVGRTRSLTGAANPVFISWQMAVKWPRSILCLAKAPCRLHRMSCSLLCKAGSEIPWAAEAYKSFRCSGMTCAASCVVSVTEEDSCKGWPGSEAIPDSWLLEAPSSSCLPDDTESWSVRSLASAVRWRTATLFASIFKSSCSTNCSSPKG